MHKHTQPCPVPHLRSWREKGAGHTVHVLGVDLDADIVEAHSMEAEAAPRGAKVTFAGIG